MLLINSTQIADSHGAVHTLSFYHVPVGEKVWVDGTAKPVVVSGQAGIPFRGVQTYPNGAFIVGTQSLPNYADATILHVNDCECFNDISKALRYFNSKSQTQAAA